MNIVTIGHNWAHEYLYEKGVPVVLKQKRIITSLC